MIWDILQIMLHLIAQIKVQQQELQKEFSISAENLSEIKPALNWYNRKWNNLKRFWQIIRIFSQYEASLKRSKATLTRAQESIFILFLEPFVTFCLIYGQFSELVSVELS